MSVYKPFTPQDYAVVPFNAHKQYNFDSSSATLNNISFFNTEHNSHSIETYQSSSNLNDGFDHLKYTQLDHLFYRNYLTDISNKFGDIDYLKHHRTLYNRSTVLSVPSGLYGHKIKPGSLEFEAGLNTLIDDSYGNLVQKGININNFITDPRLILLDLGPVKGFKRYDLDIYNDFIENIYYKKGQSRVNTISSYTTPSDKYEYDDSYFLNKIYYSKVNFSEVDLGTYVDNPKKFSEIDFLETGSEVKIPHNNNLNFNKDNDYAIEFFIKSSPISESGDNNRVHVLSKSTLRTTSPIPSDYIDSLGDATEELSEDKWPFKIYLTKNSDTINNIHFSVSDGKRETIIQTQINVDTPTHIVCNRKNNFMYIHKGGNQVQENSAVCTSKNTNNTANIYIGGGPNITSRYNNNSFSGSICNLKIYDTSLTSTNIYNHFLQKNSSPYLGNIFYSHGLINVTHPSYISQYGVLGIGSMDIDDNNIIEPIFTVGGIVTSNVNWLVNIKFQGSHLIYENEYKCTIDEFEFNNTLNPTARENKSPQEENIANFATGSLFKPYITTIGLYNKNNELLVVGKLGQPVRTSNETDTTLVVRWDI